MSPKNKKNELPGKDQNIVQSVSSQPTSGKRAREEESSGQSRDQTEAHSPHKRIKEVAKTIKQETTKSINQEAANINKTKQKAVNNKNTNNAETPKNCNKLVKTEKEEANKASLCNVKVENSRLNTMSDEDGELIVPDNTEEIIVPEEPGKIIAPEAVPKYLYHEDRKGIVSHDVNSIIEIDKDCIDHDKDFIDHKDIDHDKDFIDLDKNFIDHEKDFIDHEEDCVILERDNSDSPDEDPLSSPSQKVLRSNSTHKEHMLMEHETKLYECHVCSFNSVNPETLENHIFKQHVLKVGRVEPVSLDEVKNDLDDRLSKQAPQKVILEDGVSLGHDVGYKAGFTCAVCNRVFTSKYSLMKHIQIHTEERPYSCDICSFTTRFRDYMQRHMTTSHLIVHSDEPKLKYSSKARKKSEERNISTEDSKEEKDPDTENVNKDENKKGNKNEHKDRNENEDGKNEANEEMSTDCSLNSADTTDTTSHGGKKRRNILRKRFECATCGMKATHKTDLVVHIREKHPNALIESLDNGDWSKGQLSVTGSKKSNVNRQTTCSYCSKVFHDNWKYKVHMRVHTGIKPFGCSVCSFYATSKMTVRDHIHRKHKNCVNPKIILRTVNIDGTVGHTELGMPHQEFKCDYCEKVFEDNYHYKQHKRSNHKDALPYSCTKCNHKESVRAKMIMHCMQNHSDEELEGLILHNNKPFNVGLLKLPKCQQCDKIFPYQSLLNIHQKQHTGERSLFCDICSYRTNIKAALEKHILKHLDDEPSKKSGVRRSTRNKVTESDEPIIFVDIDKVNNDVNIGKVKEEDTK
nr:zinc finger protein Xfin-like isoform X4 [Procambarus clarkii]XP_045617422.1 zinc finger protein Xfin-like isoform X4 [Procambarus clarkii]XP_045617423.1 zinc finger protein Xfin-like isoform X4 [Procambarus clarkii]